MLTYMPAPSDTERLEQALRARPGAILIHTTEEMDARRVIRGATSRLRRSLLEWSAVSGLRDGSVDHFGGGESGTENPAAALFAAVRDMRSDTVAVFYDLGGHLDDATTLRAWREAVRGAGNAGATMILVDHRSALPDVVREEAAPFDLSIPDDDEVEHIIRRTIQQIHQERSVEAVLSRTDLSLMVRNLVGLSRRQCERIVADVIAIDWRLDSHDINHILARKRQLLHRDGLLDYVEAPVDLSEVGGLNALKAWLEQRKRSFSKEASTFGLTPPRGVLLLGVQGAGKSLCAKAIATAWARPLLRLDPGALYDRYVGESERRLREALRQAEAMAPIVLWIDEIEKGFASAASRSTDGGLSQRMFGSLLTWMQEHDAPVFLVATANDIEALPPELLRKGRFDAIFFVDLPSAEARKQILEIHLRKRKRDPAKFDLYPLVEASEGYSGAEIEQAIIDALHGAFATGVELNGAQVRAALVASPPLSVTMAERIDRLRAWSEGRCVCAE